jgi:hypothetical protein
MSHSKYRTSVDACYGCRVDGQKPAKNRSTKRQALADGRQFAALKLIKYIKNNGLKFWHGACSRSPA